MAIDSHMHLNKLTSLNEFYSLLKINRDKYLESVINVGLNIETSKQITNMSKENPKVFTAVGIHPLYTSLEDLRLLPKLINKKVVAIGEIGLDEGLNNHLEQRYYFIKQLMLANELKLPVIIHATKETTWEILNIFQTIVKPKYGCVFHSFYPDLETFKYLMANEYYISFAGKITFKTASKSHEIIKLTPKHLILAETDSPYIPIGLNKEKERTPANLRYVIKTLADVKGMSKTEMAQITTENTKRLFKKLN